MSPSELRYIPLAPNPNGEVAGIVVVSRDGYQQMIKNLHAKGFKVLKGKASCKTIAEAHALQHDAEHRCSGCQKGYGIYKCARCADAILEGRLRASLAKTELALRLVAAE